MGLGDKSKTACGMREKRGRREVSSPARGQARSQHEESGGRGTLYVAKSEKRRNGQRADVWGGAAVREAVVQTLQEGSR